MLGFGPSIGGATLASHRRLAEAHAFFATYLDEQREQRGDLFPTWLRDLADKVTKHLKLIFYVAPSEEDAFVIFETMNDRGKPITETDKVKTHLLYVATRLVPLRRRCPGEDMDQRRGPYLSAIDAGRADRSG